MTFSLAKIAGGLALVGSVGIASAAVVFDLSAGGQVNINGAWFYAPPSPEILSGTGFWDPFVRLETTSGSSGSSTTGGCVVTQGQGNYCEQGYNTSDRPVQFDEKTDGNYTRDLLFGTIPIVTFKGAKYLEFLLDIAEPNGNGQNLLSLDQLQLFVGANQTNSYTPTTGNGTLGMLSHLWSLDDGADNYIKLNYDLVGQGNARADMVALIPLSAIPANLPDGSYAYLFSRFGDQISPASMIAEGSFEEWAIKSTGGGVTCPPGSTDPDCNVIIIEVPEPGSLALFAVGLAGLALARRRKR